MILDFGQKKSDQIHLVAFLFEIIVENWFFMLFLVLNNPIYILKDNYRLKYRGKLWPTNKLIEYKFIDIKTYSTPDTLKPITPRIINKILTTLIGVRDSLKNSQATRLISAVPTPDQIA